MHPIGSLWKDLDSLSPCLRSSGSKYNPSPVDFLLFLLLHFNLNKLYFYERYTTAYFDRDKTSLTTYIYRFCMVAYLLILRFRLSLFLLLKWRDLEILFYDVVSVFRNFLLLSLYASAHAYIFVSDEAIIILISDSSLFRHFALSSTQPPQPASPPQHQQDSTKGLRDTLKHAPIAWLWGV